MENHPIPQQISSYQFRLVGDMTLKQFFQLAGGALIALLFYASPLPPLVKWPFIILFGLLGVALAFLPFEERPLEKWIAAFLRSIYSPTIFSWKKTEVAPIFFQEEVQTGAYAPTPQSQQVVENYLSKTAVKNPLLSQFENAEKSFLSGLTTLFGPGSPQTGEIRFSTPAPQINTNSQPQIPVVTPQTVNVGFTAPTISSKPKFVVEENAQPKPFETFKPTAPVFTPEAAAPARQAQFSSEAAPPTPVTQPNIITGQVLDEGGKIVEGAIMEIKDSAGRPVRALKSNKLGHFMIVTPLMNGRYEIITEKEGLIFEPSSFEATGAIIPPIAVRAKLRPQIAVNEIGGKPSSFSASP